MAAYSDWVDAVSIHLENCPRVAVIGAVKSCVIEFCDKSHAWIFEHPEVTLVDGENRYQLVDMPNDSSICKVWGLRGHNAYSCDERDNPRYHYEHPDLIVIDDELSVSSTLTTITPLLSLKPRQSALDCPDFIADDYFECILNGAVAYLQMQPTADWSQPNMAAVHQAEYLAGIERARSRLADGFGKAKPRYRVQPQYL